MVNKQIGRKKLKYVAKLCTGYKRDTYITCYQTQNWYSIATGLVR